MSMIAITSSEDNIIEVAIQIPRVLNGFQLMKVYCKVEWV